MTTMSKTIVKIDSAGVYYRDLNARLRKAIANGATKIELQNVYGQRYIGTDLDKPVEIEIYGTPGNDLGAFMNGPRIIVHGSAQYMAGGTIILLGLNLKEGQDHLSRYVGTGMHGGVIYVRGNIPKYHLGREVGVAKLNDKDNAVIKEHVSVFSELFGFNADDILKGNFIRLYPRWLRPYGRLYAY
jgi:glutamate synthase domain-containing protein 3